MKKYLLLAFAFILFLLPLTYYSLLKYSSHLRIKISAVTNAKSNDISYCKIAELGIRSCGGPKEYLYYSTENTNEESLEKLIQKYNSVDKTLISLDFFSLMGSGCSGSIKPRPELHSGNCTGVYTPLTNKSQ